MRKKYSVVLVLIICLLSITACAKKQPLERTIDIKDFRNEWLVINYWASWCKPCIKEIPELNRLHQSREDITVVGVNYDGMRGQELANESSKLGIKFPNLSIDPSPFLKTNRPVVLPTTMLIDSTLKLRETLIGPQTLESINLAIVKISKQSGS